MTEMKKEKPFSMTPEREPTWQERLSDKVDETACRVARCIVRRYRQNDPYTPSTSIIRMERMLTTPRAKRLLKEHDAKVQAKREAKRNSRNK